MGYFQGQDMMEAATSATKPFGEARLDEIEAVAAVLRDSAVLTEIEMRQGDALLRVRRSPAARALSAPARLPARGNGAELALPREEAVPAATDGDVAAPAPLPPSSAENAGAAATPVTASLVGVFHAGRVPVAPGNHVTKRQVVGQIEAMRLMNDVFAPVEGVVAAVHVEEGQPVEYGQPLFEITSAAAPPEKTS